MQLKTKISLLLFTSLSFFFVIVFWNSIGDMRKASQQSAQSQALATAKIIEAGLNAHMLSGTMDQRDEFLKQVSSLESMKQLWIVRSQKVSNQYGEGPFAHDARDGLDKSVLDSGEMVVESRGDVFEDATVRLSYPYKATTNKEIDCLSCHDVKVGDTLGVISLEMKTNDLKALNYRNIIMGAILLIVLFALMTYFLKTKILIYFDRFDAIGKCVRAAENGNLSARIPEEYLKDDDAASLNRFIEKVQTSLEKIKSNFSSLIGVDDSVDPLDALTKGSERFADVREFSQLLQKDINTKEVYYHIANHFSEKFGIDDVNIVDYNTLSQETTVGYETKQIVCDAVSGCRAARALEIVDSSQMGGICPKMITPDEHYICFPCSITPSNTIVVSMVSEKKSLLYPVRGNEDLIKETLIGIKEQVAQRQMQDSIKSLERVDSISGLFNQSYLDERMVQIVKESKRAAIPYGVLVMNLDRFTAINDAFGTKIGDKALGLIGRLLLDSLRESDLIVRTFQDEFVVLLYDCDPDGVASVGEKIRSLFANKKLKTHPGGLIVTMSIGSAVFPRQHKDIAQCVQYARLAMKEAKEMVGT